MPDPGADQPPLIRVDLVCLWPGTTWRRSVDLPPGSTVTQAIANSGWHQLPARPEIAAIGIHGRIVDGDQVLRPGDRIELYRPLLADPKASRRERATQASLIKR